METARLRAAAKSDAEGTGAGMKQNVDICPASTNSSRKGEKTTKPEISKKQAPSRPSLYNLMARPLHGMVNGKVFIVGIQRHLEKSRAERRSRLNMASTICKREENNGIENGESIVRIAGTEHKVNSENSMVAGGR